LITSTDELSSPKSTLEFSLPPAVAVAWATGAAIVVLIAAAAAAAARPAEAEPGVEVLETETEAEAEAEAEAPAGVYAVVKLDTGPVAIALLRVPMEAAGVGAAPPAPHAGPHGPSEAGRGCQRSRLPSGANTFQED
jgi:hypothetical protein